MSTVENNTMPQNDISFPESKAIELYEIVIKALADSRGDKLFENSGFSHASIVLSNIFRTAKDYVIMFVGDFNGKVSDQEMYLSELKSFLQRGRSITVIFENKPNDNSKAFQTLKNVTAGCKVEFFQLSDPNFKGSPHFTVADDRMFRLEEDTVNFKAICSFNNEAISQKLQGLYDLLKSKSTRLAI